MKSSNEKYSYNLLSKFSNKLSHCVKYPNIYLQPLKISTILLIKKFLCSAPCLVIAFFHMFIYKQFN